MGSTMLERAKVRLNGILVEILRDEFAYHPDSIDTDGPASKMADLSLVAAGVGRDEALGQVLHAALYPFHSFVPAHEPREYWIEWKRDLDAAIRCVRKRGTRGSESDSVLGVKFCLPRHPPEASWEADLAARELADYLARSSMDPLSVTEARWSLKHDIAESYSSTKEFLEIVWEYDNHIRALLQRVLVDGFTFDRHARILAGMKLLRCAIDLRLQVDVMRWSQARRGKLHERFRAADYDARLRLALNHLLHRMPLYMGAVPSIPTHEYGRGEHHAITTATELWSHVMYDHISEDRLVLASSAMGLLSNIIALIDEGYEGGVVAIAATKAPYDETQKLIATPVDRQESGWRRFNEFQVSNLERSGLESIEDAYDVLLLEPVPNHVRGEPANVATIIQRIQGFKRLRWIVVDVTMAPLSDRGFGDIPPEVVLVCIESLTKFAQLGNNVCVAGSAAIFAGASRESEDRASRFIAQLRHRIIALGQQPDPRLVFVLTPCKKVYERRVGRMQRNTSLLARWFREKVPAVTVDHTATAHGASTVLFLRGVIPGRRRHGCNNDSRVQAFLVALRQSLRDDYVEHDFIRTGTSFGFNRTTVMDFPPRDGRFLLRIAAGAESVESLRTVFVRLLDGLFAGFQRAKDAAIRA